VKYFFGNKKNWFYRRPQNSWLSRYVYNDGDREIELIEKTIVLILGSDEYRKYLKRRETGIGRKRRYWLRRKSLK